VNHFPASPYFCSSYKQLVLVAPFVSTKGSFFQGQSLSPLTGTL
jgi:hypothetical protein